MKWINLWCQCDFPLLLPLCFFSSCLLDMGLFLLYHVFSNPYGFIEVCFKTFFSARLWARGIQNSIFKWSNYLNNAGKNPAAIWTLRLSLCFRLVDRWSLSRMQQLFFNSEVLPRVTHVPGGSRKDLSLLRGKLGTKLSANPFTTLF